LGGESSAFVSAGSVDITPDRPLPLAGYADRRGPSRGVADPLELNALLLRAPGQSVAILTADLLFVTAELKARLLEAVGAKLGLDEASLLVAASHTHTAPAVDASKPRLGVCDAAYADLVAGRATELLGQLASIDPVPCHIDYRTGSADHAINRRRPGWRGVRSAPNPAGPRDETVHLLTCSDQTDRPLAVLWSYACHPVGFPARPKVRADFPGVVRRALRAARGAGLPVLLLPGFAGAVGPTETGADARFGRSVGEPGLARPPRRSLRRRRRYASRGVLAAARRRARVRVPGVPRRAPRRSCPLPPCPGHRPPANPAFGRRVRAGRPLPDRGGGGARSPGRDASRSAVAAGGGRSSRTRREGQPARAGPAHGPAGLPLRADARVRGCRGLSHLRPTGRVRVVWGAASRRVGTGALHRLLFLGRLCRLRWLDLRDPARWCRARRTMGRPERFG